MDAQPASLVELIPELDLVVTQDPTNVWLLNDGPIGDFKQYEQWEKGRPFKAKAIFRHASGADYYLKNTDDPYGVRDIDTSSPYEADELALAAERPGKRHKVGPNETVWSIATAYKLSPTKLMDHNEITDGKTVTPGSWLYIPTPDRKAYPDIEYRVLAEPRPMHVNHAAWTTKYVFGNVRRWDDIKADKDHYKDGQNVDIYAVAKVPVEGTIAAYYMDKHDLGKYQETGRPAFTRGFNWQHLEEGHIEQKAKKTTPEMVAAIAEQFDDRPEPTEPATVSPTIQTPESVSESPNIDTPEEPAVSPIERELDDYKTSFRYLNVEESPELFKLLQDVDIREFDGQSDPIHKKEGSTVKVIGWFTHDNTPYLRVATRFWFGIPAHQAINIENDVFNEGLPTTLSERVVAGSYLTDNERRLATIARTVAKYQRGKDTLKKIPSLFRRK